MYFWIRKCVVLLFAVALFGGGGLAWYAYMHYTDPQTVRRLVIEAAQKALPGAQVNISTASFCLLGGVRLDEVEVLAPDPDGSYQTVIQCERLQLYPNRDEILRGSLQFQKIVLEKPALFLRRNGDGIWNLAQWIKEKPVVFKYGVEIQVRDGTFTFQDQTQVIPQQAVREINARVTLLPKSSVRWELAAVHDLLHKLESSGIADLERKALHVQAKSSTTLGPSLLAALQDLDLPFDTKWCRQLGGSLSLQLDADATKSVNGVIWNAKITGGLNRGTLLSSSVPYPVTDAEAAFTLSSEGLDLTRLRFTFGPAWGEISATMPQWDLERFHASCSLWSLPIDQQLYPYLAERHQITWERFAPSGKADMHFVVRRRDERWVPTGRVEFSNVAINFHKFPYPVRDGQGRVVFHEDGHVSFEGTGRAGDRPVSTSGVISSTQANAPLEVRFDVQQVPIDSTLRGSFCALPLPVQQTVEKFNVDGFCDVSAKFTRPIGQEEINFEIKADLTCSQCISAYFPYPLRNVAGTILISKYKTEFVHFTGVGLENSATVEVSGQVLKTTDGTQLEVAVEAKEVPLDGTLRGALGPNWTAAWNSVQPEGKIDLACLIVKQSDLPIDTTLFISPKQASITPIHFPYRLHDLQGMIRVADGKVAWMGNGDEPRMLAHHGNVVISSSGQFDTAGGWHTLTLNNLTCMRLPVDDELRCALPAQLRYAADFLAPDRPIELELRRLELTWPEDRSMGPTASIDAMVRLRDANIVPAVGIRRVSGSVTLAGTCSDDYLQLLGEVDLDSISVNGFVATNVTTPLLIQKEQHTPGSEASGRVDLTEIRGDFYAGRITGKLRSIVGDNPAFEFNLNVANASLNNYVRNSYRNPPAVDGIVDAGLLLTGSGETIGTLNGAGSVRIRQADLYRLPLIYDIVRLFSGEIPSDRVFDDVLCDFTLRDKLMLISKLELTGPSLSLIGEKPAGRMNLETNDIGVTMKTRWAKGQLRFPLVTDAANFVNDQIGIVQVRGKLQNPSIYYEPVPGVLRIFKIVPRVFERIADP